VTENLKRARGVDFVKVLVAQTWPPEHGRYGNRLNSFRCSLVSLVKDRTGQALESEADVDMTEGRQGLVRSMRVLSAIVLFAIAGIHLFLVFDGVGDALGMLFVFDAVAAVVLAIGMLALRGMLSRVAAVLSLLFVIGTLLALILALTVGLFGVNESWSFTLVPQTIVVESIGIVVLGLTLAAALRTRRSA